MVMEVRPTSMEMDTGISRMTSRSGLVLGLTLSSSSSSATASASSKESVSSCSSIAAAQSSARSPWSMVLSLSLSSATAASPFGRRYIVGVTVINKIMNLKRQVTPVLPQVRPKHGHTVGGYHVVIGHFHGNDVSLL